MLGLCDTRDQEKDVYVHHLLVSEGFAKYQQPKVDSLQEHPTQEATTEPEPEPEPEQIQSLAVPAIRRYVKRLSLH